MGADIISGQDTLLILIGQVAFIIGYVGFWRLYAGRVGQLGKNALRLFCGGGIVLAIGHVTFTSILPFDIFILVIIGLLLMVVGLILFGIVNWRQSVLVRWQWLPLVTGLLGFIGFFLFSGEEITAVPLLIAFFITGWGAPGTAVFCYNLETVGGLKEGWI